jgi:hypothetical protein
MLNVIKLNYILSIIATINNNAIIIFDALLFNPLLLPLQLSVLQQDVVTPEIVPAMQSDADEHDVTHMVVPERAVSTVYNC